MEPLRAYDTRDILNNYASWLRRQGDDFPANEIESISDDKITPSIRSDSLRAEAFCEPDEVVGNPKSCSEERSQSQSTESESPSEVLSTEIDTFDDDSNENYDPVETEDDEYDEYDESKDEVYGSLNYPLSVNAARGKSIKASAEESGEVGPSQNAKRAGETVTTQERLSVFEPQPSSKLLGVFKTDFHNALTISDDQSAGSKIEERNLLVLRDRTEKAAGPHSEPERLPGATIRLQEYQMQLMLLEQQNKKRLMMARQEAEDLLTGSIAGEGQERITEAGPSISTAKVPLINQSNEVDSRVVEAGLQGVLRGANSSILDLEKIHDYIQLLQAKAERFEAIKSQQKPYRYQVLYRLDQIEAVVHKGRHRMEKRMSLPFFDHPEWVQGPEMVRRVQCNIPLNNFDLYLEKNKDISFIVYRTFDPTLDSIVAKPATDDNRNDRGSHLPKHTGETIRLVAEDLVEAIKAFLESREEYADLLLKYRASGELPAPYLFIYHGRKSLEDIQSSLSMTTQPQLSLLLDYVKEQYGHEYAAADSLLSQNKISQEFARYLFKPGDVLVSRTNSHYAGYVATSWPTTSFIRKNSHMLATPSSNGISGGFYGSQDARARRPGDKISVHVWAIKVWYWDFDGNFQRRNQMLELEIPADEDESTKVPDSKSKQAINGKEANGERNIADLKVHAIADLKVFPLQYASTEVVDTLRRRGKTFWKCRGRRFVSYFENEKENIQYAVEERYMIDLKTHRSLHPDNRHLNSILVDELGPEAMSKDEPPDKQFELLLPLKIKGYNLRRKKWFDLVADRIYDVTWNREAFQNLVIDRKARDLIRALVSNQLASEKATDLIAGKGNGLILLLHGGPGTGKTLTAESVAEIAEKPLYRVTCGDVGTKAEDVEKYLESVLYLGKIWGCVVLLDEADVFLEQRSLEDLQRNALVSVFLRVLEYYEGILILTSNRVGTFDEAFKSRIQLALHYPTLGAYQRLRIWENFFNRLESFGDDSVDIADLRDHLEDLKEENLNGREIRNAITTARVYAEWRKTTLTYAHLKDVIEVSGRFDKYLDKLNGGNTQDELAEDEGLRLA